MGRYEYWRPQSLDEVWRLRREVPAARVVAGGTDLFVQMRHAQPAPPALISLRGVAELTGIESTDEGGIRIGAAVTLADLIRHPDIHDGWPAIGDAAERLGSPQIRNVATIGGNLCNASPCANLAPPLLVHEARLRIDGPGHSREIAVADFFTGCGTTCLAPDELVTAIVLAPVAPGTRAAFFRNVRVQMDLALVSVAVALQMDGATCTAARLAAGSVAPTPIRLPATEASIIGHPLDAERIAAARHAAMAEISPISDVRATAEYRRHIVGVFVQRALENPAGIQPPNLARR